MQLAGTTMRQLLLSALVLLTTGTTGCATFSWEGAAGANIQATAYARSTWTEGGVPSLVTTSPVTASQLPGTPVVAAAQPPVVVAPRLLPAARPAFLARRSMTIAMAPTLR